jgi:hypothetical protein
MTGKIAPEIVRLVVVTLTTVVRAAAQDVPGIEICTRESQPDRRVSCLQSNVEFLQQLISKSTRETQQKLNSAAREISALKELQAVATANMAELRERLAESRIAVCSMLRRRGSGDAVVAQVPRYATCAVIARQARSRWR